MVMTDEEICIQYKDAKKKQQQIGILADLNVCTRKEMTEKLTSLGLIEEKKPAFEPEFESRRKELYAQELCDSEIAERMGEPKSKIVAWRKSKGLSAYYPTHKHHAEPAPAPVQVSPKPDPSPSQVSPKEMVKHPAHYNKGGIECIDALNSMITGYTDPVDAVLSWQTVKYIWRHPWKGKPLEDFKKARFYLDSLIAKMEAGK